MARAPICSWARGCPIHLPRGSASIVRNRDIYSASTWWCTPDRCWEGCITSTRWCRALGDPVSAEHSPSKLTPKQAAKQQDALNREVIGRHREEIAARLAAGAKRDAITRGLEAVGEGADFEGRATKFNSYWGPPRRFSATTPTLHAVTVHRTSPAASGTANVFSLEVQ